MKKILLILAVVTCGMASAQYTKLKDFAGGATDGKGPYGDLVSDGTYLYGMTYQGGTSNAGVIFKILPNGTGYSVIYSFGAGGYPQGSLIYDGTYLYGMTHQDGANNYGTIFKVLPTGSGYTIVHSFVRATTGAYPQGSLTSDGTYLYGMTWMGGTNDNGVLFKILPNGSGYVNIMNFATGSATIGGRPNGNVHYDGTYLYGMTSEGGLYNYGLIFRIKPDASGYQDLFDFTGAADGRAPYGSLVSDGTYLYGMTTGGGASGFGVVFKIKPDGTGYTNMLDFDGTANGRSPFGSLIYDGTFLYGMTYAGGTSLACGTNGCGLIFKIKPDGSGYLRLMNFINTNGSFPQGSFVSDGNFLYAMTEYGGPAGFGTIFKYHPDMTVSAAMVGSSVCVNQCTGSASASVTSYGTPPYTYSWSNGETTSTATGLCAGVNTVTVTDTYTFTATDTVSITSYAVMTTTFTTTNVSCTGGSNGTATVNMTNGTAPYTYLWTNNQTNQTASGLSAATGYSVTITDSKGCSVVGSTTVAVDAAYPSVPICLVTVDSLSENNVIAWEKPVTGRIDSFIIYREISTNNYQPIGAVSFSDSSKFVDTVRLKYAPNTGDPNNGTYRYKMQVRDTCGNLSPLSPYHNTIYVSNNNGLFSWAQLYTIEGSGNPVNNYLLMRDDSSDGNWQSVASVAGTQQQVNDPAYNTWKNVASWRIHTQWAISCAISIKNPDPMVANLNLSKSNINKVLNPTAVPENGNVGHLQIYPNPSAGKITVNWTGGAAEMEFSNLLGEQVLHLSKSGNRSDEIDISSMPDGVYFLKISNEQGSAVKKVFIRK